jgi:hypothetical protein
MRRCQRERAHGAKPASLVPSAAMSAHATWTTDIPKDDESVGGERNDDVPIEAVRWEYFTWAPTHTVWFWKVGRR